VSARAPSDLARVRFVDAPVRLMLAANRHQQELVRELTLIHLSEDASKEELPTRLVRLVERHRQEFSALTIRRRTEIADEIARGGTSVDLEIDVPARAGPAAAEMLSILAEADEFCRRGELLTLAPAPEFVEFREWFLGEIVRQLAGHPPTSWPKREAA
jgi:hypothetical protein